ncbi:hypothetical protein AAFF_G00384960 [Aldrovandia affinis]|uniref:Cytochrome P450 n=1 Tax=Aldrovandia affinis TaxID=143900 RepID=A0AAD7WLM4_9TELE|nr:hypothetical protein AAFF_G00384960 [Aldrovandia affinis]
MYRREGEPPLIKGWIPYLGKAVEFTRDAHKFLTTTQDKHGDIFTVRIAGKYITFVMDPVLYPCVIKQGKKLDFHELSHKAGQTVFTFPPDLGIQGLAENLAHTFSFLRGDHLILLTESMMGNLQLVLKQDYLCEESGWRVGGVHHFCRHVMFEATFLTLFGKPSHTTRHVDTDALREKLFQFDGVFLLLLAQVPISLLGSMKTIREEIICSLLPENRQKWCGTSRFLQETANMLDLYPMFREKDKAGLYFSLLWGSVTNTIPAMFWTMYHLLKSPEALATVRRELNQVLQLSGQEVGCGQDITLTQEQLDSLLYLGSAIKESLRLYSVAANFRLTQEDFNLQLDRGRCAKIRKGDFLVLFPMATHLDPEVYEDPEVYKFDRFVEDGKEKKDFYKRGQKLKYYLMPFASGSTICPGRFLATNGIKLLLSLVLLHLDVELLDNRQAVTMNPGRIGLGTVSPNSDPPFRYRPRPL